MSFVETARSLHVAAAGVLILLISAVVCGSKADTIPDGQRLILQDWGVYTGKLGRLVSSPTSSTGNLQLSEDEHLLLQTHVICAALGTAFGLRFKLPEASRVPLLPITVEITHPPLINREGRKQTLDTFTKNVVPGRLDYVGWLFREDGEIVAGNWRFVLLSVNVILLDQSFTVKTSCSPPVG